MSTNRRLVTIASVAAVLILITAAVAFGVRLLLHTATTSSTANGCVVGQYHVSTDQAAVASTMVGVVITRGLPERAAVLVLAAGLQESKLTNLATGDGDRDSVGVLQQRPSQGWGTVAQLNDVHFATGAFLDALLKQSDWQTKPLAEAIQTVQISADGDLYAQHEPEAQALADALTGTTLAGISCHFPTPDSAAHRRSGGGQHHRRSAGECTQRRRGQALGHRAGGVLGERGLVRRQRRPAGP